MSNQTNPTSDTGFLAKFKARLSWKRMAVSVTIYGVLCALLWTTPVVQALETHYTPGGWGLIIALTMGILIASAFVKGFIEGAFNLKNNLVGKALDQVAVWLSLAGSIVLIGRYFPDKVSVEPALGIFVLYGALAIAGFIDDVVERKFFTRTES